MSAFEVLASSLAKKVDLLRSHGYVRPSPRVPARQQAYIGLSRTHAVIFQVNDITAEKQMPVLLSVIGRKTYPLSNLLAPVKSSM